MGKGTPVQTRKFSGSFHGLLLPDQGMFSFSFWTAICVNKCMYVKDFLLGHYSMLIQEEASDVIPHQDYMLEYKTKVLN